MAPHWTLALLLVISVFLGIGRASVVCESDDNTKCVDEDNCDLLFHYRFQKIRGCQPGQVCCAVDNIKEEPKPMSCGVNGKKACVAADLCRPEIQFRIASRCPDNLVCCEVEEGNNLSIMDPDV